MAPAKSAPHAKLFLAALHRNPEIFNAVVPFFQERFGPIDFVSEDFPFRVTTYYEKEMGPNLSRRFYSFERLIDPAQIVEAKLYTNQLEDQFREGAGRAVNLDPGYLDLYKVVLASTKFGGQKIYLKDGIYADMTLVMFKGKWELFDWSFPDFKSGQYDAVLLKIRELYKARVRSLKIS